MAGKRGVGSNFDCFFTRLLGTADAAAPPAGSRGERSSDCLRSLKDEEPQFVSRPNWERFVFAFSCGARSNMTSNHESQSSISVVHLETMITHFCTLDVHAADCRILGCLGVAHAPRHDSLRSRQLHCLPSPNDLKRRIGLLFLVSMALSSCRAFAGLF